MSTPPLFMASGARGGKGEREALRGDNNVPKAEAAHVSNLPANPVSLTEKQEGSLADKVVDPSTPRKESLA